MSDRDSTRKPELADDAACARLSRRLQRLYGLCCTVETQHFETNLRGCRGGRGSMIRVEWLARPDALVARGLTSHGLVEQVLRTGQSARFIDRAGTHWYLHPNGGARGDEYGMGVVAFYPPDFHVDPVGVRTVKLTRAVERMVRKATGRKVRFQDTRATAQGAA